jgi:immune inhibitor A
LNYEVAVAGSKSTHKLGPAETNTKQAQALFVILPPKAVTDIIADPYDGDYFYYSGAGNNLDNLMSKTFDLAAGSSLSAMANVQIEIDWDYAYLVVSTDGGSSWSSVETNLSTSTDPNGQNFGFGITGNSGGWTALTADLSAYTGEVMIGFRYWTDVAVVDPGFMIDNIEITGYPSDGAETGTGWTFEGFRVTAGEESAFYNNYYVAEFRQYRGYDETLANAYNFGFGGNWVEHFPYQDGLLISYWDTSFTDNNVASHPGGGLLLPIDAHPEVMYDSNGDPWRNRIQTYDATFGLEPTDAITLHTDGVESIHPSLPAVPIFDDTIQYYTGLVGSPHNPDTGTTIRIRSVSAHGTLMQIQVLPSK